MQGVRDTNREAGLHYDGIDIIKRSVKANRTECGEGGEKGQEFTSQQVHERGFASPIWPHDGDARAHVHTDVEPAQGEVVSARVSAPVAHIVNRRTLKESLVLGM